MVRKSQFPRSDDRPLPRVVIIVHDYRGYGFTSTRWPPDDGRWNAVVKIQRHFPVDAKPHAETVTCYKVTGEPSEPAASWRCLLTSVGP
jgi:hypothetical protein